MSTVVISQPMLFPWVGLFEQIALADVFVHYDDVQFSKGSFTNRVQIKTAQGSKWMTIPLKDLQLGDAINTVTVDDAKNWRHKHREFLKQTYQHTPHLDDMMTLVNSVYDQDTDQLNEILITATEQVCDYFDINSTFHRSSERPLPGSSSQRVVNYVKHFNGKTYVTGHGAKQYLDHQLFEDAAIRVAYMNYQKKPYPQQFGEFTPYVSILDLIANCGRDGKKYICSGSVYWQTYLKQQEATTV